MKDIGVAECHWVGEDRRKRKRLNGEEGMGEMSTDQPKTNRWGKDRAICLEKEEGRDLQ